MGFRTFQVRLSGARECPIGSALWWLQKLRYIYRKSSASAKNKQVYFCIRLEDFLGEYIDEEVFMKLEKEFVSIGQRLGFVSAGDYRRKLEAENAQQAKDIAAKDTEIAAKDAEIAALKAQIAAMTAK